MDTWNKLCRACLSTKKNFTYFLHQNVSPETYWFCTSVQIGENEDLPNALCNSCYRLLIAYSEFKRTCIKSQNTLLSCSDKATSAAETLTCDKLCESTENDEKTLDIIVKDEDVGNVCESTENHELILDIVVKEEGVRNVSKSTKNDEIRLDILVKENVHESTENEISLHTIVKEEDVRNICESTESDKKSLYYIKKEVDASDRIEEDFISPDEYTSDSSGKKVKIRKRKKRLISELKREVKSAIKTKRKFLYSCELCNKKFRYHERLEAHKLEHDGKSVALRCLPCDKTFMTWSGLHRHKENIHTTVSLESVSCRLCGRICKSKHTLRAHEKAHGQRASCVCDVCGKRVANAVILKAHLETHVVHRERQHTCEHCGKKFFTKTMVLSHISRQHSGRRFICEICSYPFTDKYNLIKHILKHEGKKGYKCDICEKPFATHGSLVEHKRIHSGEKPFLCSYCPKRFLSKRRLTDHHRIHTGEKPHRCGLCDQRFTQRGTLQRHMKVHDKPL